MKKIFTILFVLLFITIQAQDETNSDENLAQSSSFKIGLKGGLSLPSLSDNSNNIYTQDFESYVSFETGVFASMAFSDLLSLQVEVNYTVKGGERKGFQPIPEVYIPSELDLPPGSVLYAEFDNKSALEYIEVPILAKFTVGTDWKVFGNFGPYFGFLVGATQKTNGSSSISADIPGIEDVVVIQQEPASFTAETDVSDNIKNFNFGGIAGLGVMKGISNKSELFFEVRATYGFIPVQEEEVFGESRIGSVVFSLGYAYKL